MDPSDPNGRTDFDADHPVVFEWNDEEARVFRSTAQHAFGRVSDEPIIPMIVLSYRGNAHQLRAAQPDDSRESVTRVARQYLARAYTPSDAQHLERALRRELESYLAPFSVSTRDMHLLRGIDARLQESVLQTIARDGWLTISPDPNGGFFVSRRS